MKNYDAADVDAYIASMAPEARQKLEELRALIKKTVPQAKESISWGIPFYKHHGLLAGFAAFTKHISFGLAFVIENVYREELEETGYKTGKKTIQIGLDQELPVAMIKKLLKARAKLNEAIKR